jgi:hypothetical protein
MKFGKIAVALLLLFVGGLTSCKDHLVEMNENPNGVDPKKANPNLVFATVLSATGMTLTNLGYGDIGGVMQHTQKDGWGGGHNNYEWGMSNDWNGYYDILRNNKFVYDRSVELGFDLQQGTSLVMKSLVFGLIADLFGDAPYTAALKGDLGGNENTFPAFDSQRDIYMGVLADLEEANQLLSKAKNEYNSSIESVDMYYKGDPTKWRKLANSLALRYYMRISSKEPELAKAGIEKIMGNPTQYPVIIASADDCTMPSWTPVYDVTESNYRRVKMAQSLVETMRKGNDPRLGVWAKKVEIPLVVSDTLAPGTDAIINGKRYVSVDVLASKGLTLADVNQNQDYVGLPAGITSPAVYNMGPDPNQAAFNPHVSWLSDMYRVFNSPLLKSRILSAAEVNFILAEAALKGWSVGGTAESYYNNGIKTSMETWGVGAQYPTFIAHPEVAFNGTQKQIIEQKWVASWQAATEAWADFKRTGYPELKGGPQSLRKVLPVRFYYMLNERNLNRENTEAAMKNLEVTQYTEADGANSAWSKPWVLQGTGKPW